MKPYLFVIGYLILLGMLIYDIKLDRKPVIKEVEKLIYVKDSTEIKEIIKLNKKIKSLKIYNSNLKEDLKRAEESLLEGGGK